MLVCDVSTDQVYVRTDNRLFRMLHVLLHMAQNDRQYTSEELGAMLKANAAHVRRTMASLRDEGFVASEKGHGGGWKLSCDLRAVTLLDIYQAVGQPKIFTMGSAESDSKCLVEAVVNQSISETLSEAENLILRKFGRISISQLSDKVASLRNRGSHDPHG